MCTYFSKVVKPIRDIEANIDAQVQMGHFDTKHDHIGVIEM